MFFLELSLTEVLAWVSENIFWWTKYFHGHESLGNTAL